VDFNTDFSDANSGFMAGDLNTSDSKSDRNGYKSVSNINRRFIDLHTVVSLKEISPIQKLPNLENRLKKLAVADIFSSADQAKNAVREMQRQGLNTTQVSIVVKDYLKLENSITWETVAASGSILFEILTELGISDRAATQYVDAVEKGKFLVIATGDDWEIRKAQHVLDNISNWQFIEYFKTIITLPREVSIKINQSSF
jgi:hypothetical protein